MVKQIKKDNMRTTIVIFTDHKDFSTYSKRSNKTTNISTFKVHC